MLRASNPDSLLYKFFLKKICSALAFTVFLGTGEVRELDLSMHGIYMKIDRNVLSL